jgi:predicted SAM-dependent methyltransferase
MLDIVQRYAPIVGAIKKNPPKEKKIIEVGGGGEGLGWYLPDYQIIDADIEFVKNILPNVKPIKAKAEKLPFKDNQVETVISVDVLEHLPTLKKKRTAIKEMLRVAKRDLILAVPTGKESLEIHKKLCDLVRRRYPKLKRHYLEEHLKYGHPEKEEVLKMIREAGFKTKIKIKKNANVHLWFLFHKIYLKIPQLYHFLRHRRFWHQVLKPVLPLLNFGPSIRTIFYIRILKN